MKQSLKLKILGPILLGILVLLISLMLWAISVSGRAISDMDLNKGVTLAKVTSADMWNSLLFQDLEALKDSLKNLQMDPSLSAAAVLNADQKKVAGVGECDALAVFVSEQIIEGVMVKREQVGELHCRLFSTPIVNPEDKKPIGLLIMALSEEAVVEAMMSIRLAILIGGGIALLIVGLGAYFLLDRTMKPLLKANDLMSELSQGQGDLRVRLDVKTRDEVGALSENFNRFMETLVEIISLVKESSHELIGATDEISAGSGDLALRTNEQAASITQTSTTLEGFTTIVGKNRDNSEAVKTRLEEFSAKVSSNQQLMNDVTKTMSVISESSQQIDQIVTVINDISFQTNLLALNAAVEAARAGEAGRGFAVVASEVRNLAQKTAESSKSIQAIVSENVESTQKGLKLVKETSRFFTEIVEMVMQLVSMINEIANGSREQSAGIEQINSAVIQLEDVISQNSALVEELSATAKSMKGNASQLEELVNRFVV